jgi:hypothetical protein
MIKAALTRSLTACFLSALAGCTTLCGGQCRLERSARVLAASSDPGVRASGLRTLEDIHPRIKTSVEKTRALALPKTLECTVASVKIVDGRKVIKMTGCTNPASPAQQNP